MSTGRISNAGIAGVKYRNVLAGQSFAAGAVVPLAYYNNAGAQFVNYTFTNVPRTFQDLLVVLSTRDTSAASTATLFFGINGDTSGTSYSTTRLRGDGSSATSSRTTNTATVAIGTQPAANAAAGLFATTLIHIFNYASTSTFKTVLTRNASDINGAGVVEANVTLWRSTAAVDNFIFGSSSQFAAGTSMALYGIRAGNS